MKKKSTFNETLKVVLTDNLNFIIVTHQQLLFLAINEKIKNAQYKQCC